MTDSCVHDETRGPVTVITMDRPAQRNAQNVELTYELDRAFHRFAQDDDAKVAVLRGRGPHFSAGHDLAQQPWESTEVPVGMWWNPCDKPGAEWIMAYEQDAYLGMCRRWRELPKPTIAMVQGACLGGALALAWVCDLIVAAEDAFFGDPVVALGCPGIEWFAHPWMLGSRMAREFLLVGDRIDARRAYEIGMVNRVVANDQLEATAMDLAGRMASKPRFALALTKSALNQAEDAMGMREGIDGAFALHQLSHAHNINVSGSPILGDVGTLKDGSPGGAGPRTP